ncbi:MAG: PhnD/SsuA/transferrin family substrate-binding protein [Elusimicrobia bacterium]|nr:PhnD/SsuA/transferrin family substrate-binding protein [Elusimicrobiota bacterium]
MRQTMKQLSIALALAAGLSACVGRSESSIGTAQHPLVVLLSPAHAPASMDSLGAIAGRLSDASGLSVEARVAASPLDAIEQLGTRKADAGILTLEEFLLAREEYGVAAGLQALRGKGETQFDGVILVMAKSTAQKVSDLDGGKFGFVDPYSVSGFLLPAQFLHKEGVQVEAKFLGSHDKAMEALVRGEVAAIATYGHRALKRKDLRVLAMTGTVPNEPFVLRKGLRPEKRDALLKALQGLAGSAEGEKDLLAVADITGFGPVAEQAYRSVHDILEAAGKSVYDIVPEGAEVRRLNQPYMDLR